MKLEDASVKIIRDSRGEETIEAEISDGKISEKASVPSGKSKGRHEAFVLAPAEAPQKLAEIKGEILNRDFENQEDFDGLLLSLDGTPDKKNIGGNLVLALSLAWARLKAREENLELFEYIRKIFDFRSPTADFPKPIFNVVNGGLHVKHGLAAGKKNNLSFQEFQIIPVRAASGEENDFLRAGDFPAAFESGRKFYAELKSILEKKYGQGEIFLGDEAGFSAPFRSNEEALDILSELISKGNYSLHLGLDTAASEFYHDADAENPEAYYLVDGKKHSKDEMEGLYAELVKKYNLISVEDPFDEEAFDSFALLSAALPRTLVITDDLTATNPERLKEAIQKKAGNAILIKPNQIGSLTETLKVVRMAYENNWQAVASHRSGETLDSFIADLAVAINAWGIKAGAPATPYRLAKYERLLKISSEL